MNKVKREDLIKEQDNNNYFIEEMEGRFHNIAQKIDNYIQSNGNSKKLKKKSKKCAQKICRK